MSSGWEMDDDYRRYTTRGGAGYYQTEPTDEDRLADRDVAAYEAGFRFGFKAYSHAQELAAQRKTRKSQLTTKQLADLNLACIPIAEGFGYNPYLVGSCEQGDRDYRDVDVRLMLPDDEFDAFFGHEFFWHIFCWAVSEWMTSKTGLPVDFQVQRRTEANAKYGDLGRHPRNPLGVRGRLFAGGGDATRAEEPRQED